MKIRLYVVPDIDTIRKSVNRQSGIIIVLLHPFRLKSESFRNSCVAQCTSSVLPIMKISLFENSMFFMISKNLFSKIININFFKKREIINKLYDITFY